MDVTVYVRYWCYNFNSFNVFVCVCVAASRWRCSVTAVEFDTDFSLLPYNFYLVFCTCSAMCRNTDIQKHGTLFRCFFHSNSGISVTTVTCWSPGHVRSCWKIVSVAGAKKIRENTWYNRSKVTDMSTWRKLGGGIVLGNVQGMSGSPGRHQVVHDVYDM